MRILHCTALWIFIQLSKPTFVFSLSSCSVPMRFMFTNIKSLYSTRHIINSTTSIPNEVSIILVEKKKKKIRIGMVYVLRL